tara:strand:- start:134 stop:583 length:450 start_codon:yes stop_codon:yes gene_type:complete
MPQLGVGLFIGDTDGDSIVGPVIDGVIMAEDGAYIITESGVDRLAFEPAGTSQFFTNSDNSLNVTVTGSIAVFNWNIVSGAVGYRLALFTTSSPSIIHNVDYGPSTTSATIDLSTIGANSGQSIFAGYYWAFQAGQFNSASPFISGITF